MDQKERAEAFIEELYELSKKYDIEITGEGNSPLLYDSKDKEYIGGFYKAFFGVGYKLYFD